MRKTFRDQDGWPTPPRLPRHAAGRVRPIKPAGADGPSKPTEARGRLALRLFVPAGVCAAGLLLVAGFLVLVASDGGPSRTRPESAATPLAANGHRAALARDRDRKSGRPAPLPSTTARAAGYRGPAGHPAYVRSDRPGHSGGRTGPLSRLIASFAGHGDVVTPQFAVRARATWQIEWSYRCPASLPAGLLVVEDDTPGADGEAISASGTAGHR